MGGEHRRLHRESEQPEKRSREGTCPGEGIKVPNLKQKPAHGPGGETRQPNPQEKHASKRREKRKGQDIGSKRDAHCKGGVTNTLTRGSSDAGTEPAKEPNRKAITLKHTIPEKGRAPICRGGAALDGSKIANSVIGEKMSQTINRSGDAKTQRNPWGAHKLGVRGPPDAGLTMGA